MTARTPSPMTVAHHLAHSPIVEDLARELADEDPAGYLNPDGTPTTSFADDMGTAYYRRGGTTYGLGPGDNRVARAVIAKAWPDRTA